MRASSLSKLTETIDFEFFLGTFITYRLRRILAIYGPKIDFSHSFRFSFLIGHRGFAYGTLSHGEECECFRHHLGWADAASKFSPTKTGSIVIEYGVRVRTKSEYSCFTVNEAKRRIIEFAVWLIAHRSALERRKSRQRVEEKWRICRHSCELSVYFRLSSLLVLESHRFECSVNFSFVCLCCIQRPQTNKIKSKHHFVSDVRRKW